jgi:hypothetical protein
LHFANRREETFSAILAGRAAINDKWMYFRSDRAFDGRKFGKKFGICKKWLVFGFQACSTLPM